MRETKAANYAEAEQFISEVPKFTSKNPLEETRGFYSFIEEEIKEEQLGKLLHVAGTNGKGSVCAFAAGAIGERIPCGHVYIAAFNYDKGALCD